MEAIEQESFILAQVLKAYWFINRLISNLIFILSLQKEALFELQALLDFKSILVNDLECSAALVIILNNSDLIKCATPHLNCLVKDLHINWDGN